MNEEEFQKLMNARLEKLIDLYPIEDLRPVQATEEMKTGLAKGYANKGLRLYLENSVKIALQKMAIAPTPLEIAYYKSRVDTLQQLLAKGQQMFNLTTPKKGVS
jgi:hypothetical protein